MVQLLALCSLLAGQAWGQDGQTDRFGVAAKWVVDGYNAQDAASVVKHFSAEMAAAVTADALQGVFEQSMQAYGKVLALTGTRSTSPESVVCTMEMEQGKLQMRLALSEKDEIAGLFWSQAKPPLPVPERNSVALRLPFAGQWQTFWGGDTAEVNQHHDAENQRFAFDFVVTDAQGHTHRGTGESNEDYYAFGREVLAPAAGVVTDVIEGVRDNAPGSMNPYSALGNAVFIQHAEHEVSVVAHFRLGTIRVKVGDQVTAGQVLGLCGNSGNSSEAHIHYHLQNTPVIQDGTGIKCFFERVKVTREGKTEDKEGYSPVKGDLVEAE